MPPHNTPHNTPRIVRINDGHPVDYPIIGMRFTQPQSKPVRFYTGDELLFACFFSGLASMLFVCGVAWLVAARVL